ncbi:hypothetical protein [Hoeflea sp.]|uniref:hypothetical protein n=1 Tax=Hoeflea sp. TaxID=1940281 RepID=UPI003A955616
MDFGLLLTSDALGENRPGKLMEHTMSMMQSGPVEAFDGTECGAGLHPAVGTGFSFDADANPGGGDIVPQQAVVDPAALVSALVAAFRAHSHINNVMTHVSGARWDEIERALHIILDIAAVPAGLSRLEANIVDLLCAERGVTGRIFKPYFETLLARLLPAVPAGHLQAHVLSLHQAAQIYEEDNPGVVRIATKTGEVR